MNNALSSNWETIPLSELLTSLESGSRPKGGVRGISQGVPSIGGEHLKHDGTFDFNSIKYVPKDFADKMTKGRIKINDILVVKDGATTGKTSFVDSNFPFNDAVVNEHVFICRPSNRVNPRYLFYYLFSREGQERILENFKGSAQGGINQSFAPNTKVPIAPIGEQDQIVAKLEELLKHVDISQDRLAKILLILKRFRQSVLAAACSGKLTADWRENNPDTENIDAVIEAIKKRRENEIETLNQKNKLNEIFPALEGSDSSGLPEGWRCVMLNKLCTSFDYGTSAKSKPSGKIPVLRMGNIQNGEIDWTDLVYTSDDEEIKKYYLQSNTVLFNRTNSPELVGKTAIYRGEYPAIFAGYLIRINPLPELDPEYLNFCMNTTYAKEFCYHLKTDGVSQSNINAQKLGTFEIPLCSLVEQREIVRRVKSLFKLADQIATRYANAKMQVDKLTQSILAKAFHGELVPQNPSDESVEVLLRRIKG